MTGSEHCGGASLSLMAQVSYMIVTTDSGGRHKQAHSQDFRYSAGTNKGICIYKHEII